MNIFERVDESDVLLTEASKKASSKPFSEVLKELVAEATGGEQRIENAKTEREALRAKLKKDLAAIKDVESVEMFRDTITIAVRSTKHTSRFEIQFSDKHGFLTSYVSDSQLELGRTIPYVTTAENSKNYNERVAECEEDIAFVNKFFRVAKAVYKVLSVVRDKVIEIETTLDVRGSGAPKPFDTEAFTQALRLELKKYKGKEVKAFVNPTETLQRVKQYKSLERLIVFDEKSSYHKGLDRGYEPVRDGESKPQLSPIMLSPKGMYKNILTPIRGLKIGNIAKNATLTLDNVPENEMESTLESNSDINYNLKTTKIPAVQLFGFLLANTTLVDSIAQEILLSTTSIN